MRKLLVMLAVIVLALQVNAYVYAESYGGSYRRVRETLLTLPRPGSVTRALILTDWRSVDTDGLARHINEVLADNRAGCQALASYFGRASYCRTYVDFPLAPYGAYGTLRVYSGVERVSVGITVDRSGSYWLTFTAVDYAKPVTSSAVSARSWQSRTKYSYISTVYKTRRPVSTRNIRVSWNRTYRTRTYFRRWNFSVRSHYYRYSWR
jgi:hypothetical protein